MKVNVYHLRTMDETKVVNGKTIKMGGKPYATVAIEINSDGTVNRGISICSAKDQFVKKIGTNKAIGRLECAKERKHDVFKIDSFVNTEKKIIKKIGGVPKFKNTNFKYLGSYADKATSDELEIFEKEFRNLKR